MPLDKPPCSFSRCCREEGRCRGGLDERGPAYTEFHPRWYRPRMSTWWWMERGPTPFVLRELSSVLSPGSWCSSCCWSTRSARGRARSSWSGQQPVVLVMNLVSLLLSFSTQSPGSTWHPGDGRAHARETGPGLDRRRQLRCLGPGFGPGGPGSVGEVNGQATIEPLLWLLFSAGGVLAALLIPVLLLLFGLVFPAGWWRRPAGRSCCPCFAIRSAPRLFLLCAWRCFTGRTVPLHAL